MRLLERMRAGDADAQGELLARVYAELHRLAKSYMAAERREHTLQPTALVHEAFVRLSNGAPASPENRVQFFRTAARAMRQVLVDHARARGSAKRDGARIELDEAVTDAVTDAVALNEERGVDLLALEEALAELEATDEALAHLVELRFFGGLEAEEIAGLLGASERTVRRDLQFARAWLRRRLEGGA